MLKYNFDILQQTAKIIESLKSKKNLLKFILIKFLQKNLVIFISLFLKQINF